MNKLFFKATIISIQPRIRLTRSFDEASHTYLGYAIKIAGTVDSQQTIFSIGIGKAAQAKFNFKVNDIISGECLPVPDPDMEPVDYYKVSKLAKVAEGKQGSLSAPWELVPPELEVYRERGHRRLAARTYDSKCSSCIWGCRMPVEIIVDNWNPRGKREYRVETFCYGPTEHRDPDAGHAGHGVRDMGSGVVSQGVDADENRMDYFNYFDFVYFASCIGTNYTFYY